MGRATFTSPIPAITVPDQILIAFFAKLKLYGFWRDEGLFAELLKILENQALLTKF